MNLDELKNAWKVYDHKLQTAQQINERIIISMITERSSNRLRKVKREYAIGFAWILLWLVIGVAILTTNPFDYKLPIQYVPMAVFSACLFILLVGMGIAYTALQKVTVEYSSIETALKQIIAVYKKPRKFFMYTVIALMFCQTVMFPLSFLPARLETTDFWPALGESLIPMSVSGGLLLLAYKLGAFKERRGKEFEEDMNELDTLKSMSRELAE